MLTCACRHSNTELVEIETAEGKARNQFRITQVQVKTYKLPEPVYDKVSSWRCLAFVQRTPKTEWQEACVQNVLKEKFCFGYGPVQL